MNYIKIYENFLNDRERIYNDIEKLNSKIKDVDSEMLDSILDLIPDILDIRDFEDGKFGRFIYNLSFQEKIYAYKFTLTLQNVDSSYISKFFDKYIKIFQSDLNRIDTLDYRIEYHMNYNNNLHIYKDNSFIKSLGEKYNNSNQRWYKHFFKKTKSSDTEGYHSNIYNFHYLNIFFFKH